MSLSRKKLLALGVELITSFGILAAGCGGDTKKDDPKKAAVSDGIQKIKDRGVLKVGVKVDVPKFGFKDPKTGKIEGFEIDLSKAIAKKILG
ncbi:MAG: transporter substrate-binding domain-containing protein, partial [Lutispora sp.]